MIEREIEVSPYQFTLRMVWTGKKENGLQEVIEKFNLDWVGEHGKEKSPENFGAITFKIPGAYREIGVAFDEYEDMSIMVHEAVHIVNFIFEECGVKLDTTNDEAQAYLTAWIFNQIKSFSDDVHQKTVFMGTEQKESVNAAAARYQRGSSLANAEVPKIEIEPYNDLSCLERPKINMEPNQGLVHLERTEIKVDNPYERVRCPGSPKLFVSEPTVYLKL